MLDAATYTPRLKAQYAETIRAALKEEFGYKNDMQIPKLEKIVLNIGCGAEAVKDSKKAKAAVEDLTAIAGQKAVSTKAKKSIAGFRVREDMPLGAKVTKGDVIAMVADPLGEGETPVIADTDGVVIGRTNLPLVYEGDATFHVAQYGRKVEKVEKQVEIFQEEHQPTEPEPGTSEPADAPIA